MIHDLADVIDRLAAIPGPAHGLAREIDFDTPAGPLHTRQCRCGRILDDARWEQHMRETGLSDGSEQ